MRAARLLTAVLLVAACACSRAPAKNEDPVWGALRSGGSALQSPSLAEGHRVFVAYCATCHGDEGRGDGQNASRVAPRPPDLTQSIVRLSIADIRRIVEGGTASVGRTPLCPPHGRTLGPERTDAVVGYLRTLGPKP